MTTKVFTGKLFFNDGTSDIIMVERFIVRDEEISFHLSATWGGNATKIELDGTAVKNGNCFTSKSLEPKPILIGFYPVL